MYVKSLALGIILSMIFYMIAQHPQIMYETSHLLKLPSINHSYTSTDNILHIFFEQS